VFLEPVHLLSWWGRVVSDEVLSDLLPDEEGDGPHEGGGGELVEIQIPASEDLIDTGGVDEEGGQDGLEDDTVDHDHVDVGVDEGFPLTLAAEDVGPLDEHDGDEVAGLGVEEGLGGEAGVHVGDGGFLHAG